MSVSGLSAGSATPAEQRRHDRYQVEIPGVLRVQETRGGIYMVTVLDISKSGLRLCCPKLVPPGNRVEVKCQNTKVLGTVKYAREVGYEWNLGIEADAVANESGGLAGAQVDLISMFPPHTLRLRRPR